ncbi:MAG: recombinase family protein, partial [Candidatus Cloacimonadota bacterium]
MLLESYQRETKMQAKKCAIYTRVSTDNQVEKEFNSCKAQEEKIRSFIGSQENMKVYKVYSDPGYTGANLDRPALSEMINDIRERNIDLIISYKIDRLVRSAKDFYQLVELFEKHNVDFISVTERFDTSVPSGRLLRNIMLTFAQFERELASERTRDKMLQRAQKGMWNGGIVPFGYKTENKKLIINKKEADVVKKIFEIYTTSGSLSKIYGELKRKGTTDRQNRPLSKSALHYILRNIVYTGKIKYAGKIYQGNHEPIISEDLFNLAQECHQKKIRKLRLYKDFLLSGLISCRECNSSMTPCYTNKKTKGKTKRYYYYRCTSTFKRDWNSCNTRQVNANRLEDYVFENLERISLDFHYIDSLIFKLNHTVSDDHSGLELTQSCSQFSPQ